tara:strand:+ start:371 stop:490 length:120 start_codon:yes stop_codon:yes gene_type:complete
MEETFEQAMERGHTYKIRINNTKVKITRNKFGDIIKNRR